MSDPESPRKKTCAIVVAAGSAVRFGGDIPKQFCEVAGRPLLSWTLSRFEAAESIDEVLVVVHEDYLIHTQEMVVEPFGFEKVRQIVSGGATRQESVRLGLEALSTNTGLVAIHDGARALVGPRDIDRVVAEAAISGAAILAAAAVDTLKRADDGWIVATIDRSVIFQAQTPQVFAYEVVLGAHRKAAEESDQQDAATDDASLVEAAGHRVRVVESQYPNHKVTTADDLLLVGALLAGEAESSR